MSTSGVRRFAIRLLVLGVLMVWAASPAYAATPYDLLTPGAKAEINGAWFEALSQKHPVQAASYTPFLKISSSQPVERGYNTAYRPSQYDETNTSMPLLLSSVPQLEAGGILYRVFYLNIREPGGKGEKAYLNLDTVELWESPYPDLCGYPFDGSGGGGIISPEHEGCTTNNTATLIWDLDAGQDSFLWLNAGNVSGSRSDMQMMIPDWLFNQDPNCSWAGQGCTTYLTLYSQFGGDELPQYPNDGGPEQWGIRVPESGEPVVP